MTIHMLFLVGLFLILAFAAYGLAGMVRDYRTTGRAITATAAQARARHARHAAIRAAHGH